VGNEFARSVNSLGGVMNNDTERGEIVRRFCGRVVSIWVVSGCTSGTTTLERLQKRHTIIDMFSCS